ncbi:hypothetical protein [Jiella mangrovi]|uniref:DUF3971 domain-containing protein n=1 Tax=Jiella mangrovi TaxID=2821407 RepID=A0ABS4BK01_9HYPH|nr:hypothetical protein [Jiella mangrovi]MBP0617081.1 hypothetical protein [Jiella mangrovi]
MTSAGRILAGLCAGGLVFFIGAVALLVATTFGNRILLDQSQQLLSSLLPDDISVSVGSRSVGFTSAGDVTLQFQDVSLADVGDGRTVATADRLSVGFSLVSILSGEVSAEKISVDHMRVDTDTLSGTGDFAPPDGKAIFAALDQAATQLGDLPLKAVEVTDLAPMDGTLAPQIDRLTLVRTATDEFGLSLAAKMDAVSLAANGRAQLSDDGRRLQLLDLKSEPISLPVHQGAAIDAPKLTLSVTLDGDETGRQLELTAGVNGESPNEDELLGGFAIKLKEGEETAKIAANFSDQGSVDAEFSGELDLPNPADGIAAFRLSSTRLVSSVGQAKPEDERRASFGSSGVVDLKNGTIRIDDATLSVGEGWLKASAALTGFDTNDRVSANFRGNAIEAADLMAFWPFFVADGPRAWTLEHLSQGRIDTAAIDLDLTIERVLEVIEPHVPMRDDELQISMGFSGAAFTTQDDMPSVADARGTIRHQGSAATVNVETATLVGEPDIAVLPSSLDFRHAGDGVDAALSLNVEGGAANLLAVADRQPLMAVVQKNLKPEDLTGKAKVGIGVAFHLSDKKDAAAQTEPGKVKWSLFAELEDVDLKTPIEGRRLSNLTGTAMIAEGSVIGDLTGRIDGIAAKITFAQPIGLDPVGDASLSLKAELDDRSMAQLSPVLAHLVSGPVTVELTGDKAGFSAKADLTRATIKLPAIGWSKSEGIAGALSFRVAMDGKTTRVTNAVLKGEGFSATGSAELDEKGLKSLVLNSLALNRDDSVSARLTRVENGMGLSVAANSIDARPILAAFEKSFGAKDGEADEDLSRLVVELSADTLRGFGGETLDDAEIRYEAGKGLVRAASLTANIKGAPVSMTFQPGATSDPSLRLEAANAGALLRFSGLYEKMRGGRLKISLGERDGAYAGRVTLNDFTLVDEERLRSLVGTANTNSDSLARRFGGDLPVANAYFDGARANLRWADGRLVVDDGIIRGPVFGSSFSGTLIDPSGQIAMAGSFMPAYGVNRLFGALPLVGEVLGNGGEGGLIGITYRLEGTLLDPTLIVNPISLIAPGIFRRIFEY